MREGQQSEGEEEGGLVRKEQRKTKKRNWGKKNKKRNEGRDSEG